MECCIFNGSQNTDPHMYKSQNFASSVNDTEWEKLTQACSLTDESAGDGATADSVTSIKIILVMARWVHEGIFLCLPYCASCIYDQYTFRAPLHLCKTCLLQINTTSICWLVGGANGRNTMPANKTKCHKWVWLEWIVIWKPGMAVSWAFIQYKFIAPNHGLVHLVVSVAITDNSDNIKDHRPHKDRPVWQANGSDTYMGSPKAAWSVIFLNTNWERGTPPPLPPISELPHLDDQLVMVPHNRVAEGVGEELWKARQQTHTCWSPETSTLQSLWAL